VDHGDHNPPWWTRSVQDHRRPRSDIFLMQVGGEGNEKTVPDVEAVEREISDLRSQLDCTAQTIVGKDNDLERPDKEKEKLQQGSNRTKQRMRQIGCMRWKEGV